MKRPLPDSGWLWFGVALVLRVGWVTYAWVADGGQLTYDDEHLHWQLARNLVDHDLLITDDGRFAARMPLYPLFLALFAWWESYGVLAARIGQALISAATVAVAHRWARAASGRRPALAVGLLVAVDPFAVFFANLLLTETLFAFLAVGLSACAWRVLETRLGDRAAFIGLALLGPAAVLTRPSAAAWLPLLWLVVLLAHRNRAGLRGVLICAAVCAALLLPWGLRNKVVLGSFAWLSTNGGATLYDAQGPQADGSSNQDFLRQRAELRDLGEVALDRTLRKLAWRQVRADPGRALRLAGVKFLRTWSPTPHVAEYRTGWTAAVGAAYTVVVLLAGVAGLLRARRGALRYQLVVWLPVLYFTLLHCIFIGSVRYRVPLMPFVALAAACMERRPEAPRLREESALHLDRRSVL